MPTSESFGRARLSFASDADIDEFAEVLGRFERGEITPEQWRVFRLVRGTYGQRQLDDAQMIRVKIPQGILSATQLNVIADMGPDCMLLAQIFRPVVQCEALRTEVFAGKRSPLIFGEPQE